MIRVFVLYPQAPDPDRYAQHVELNRREVPGATIRHGPIIGSAAGESDLAYYFEYEFADRDAWRTAREGLMKVAEDARALGVPFRVYFAEIE